MSFLDLEKNGTQTHTAEVDKSSGIRIEELNNLVDDLDGCIIDLNRGVKHVLGNKKRDNLDVRQELEKSMQDMNARISEYELTTGFQPMGKNFVNKVERDLSGLIMEFEVLKGQYYKRKLMFPIYTTNETSNGTETSNSSDESLLRDAKNTGSKQVQKQNYGTFSSKDSTTVNKGQEPAQHVEASQWDAGTGGKDATYYSIPNNGASHEDDSQAQMQLQVETEARGQQVQQQLQQAQDHMDQQLLDEHELVVGEQETQMNVIHDQVTEVNLIFKQLGHLIQEQGTQVDSIENNLNVFNDDVYNASNKLKQAEKDQRTRNRCGLVFLVVISMFLFILFIAII